MNLKPLIKVLKLLILEAASIFMAIRTNLPRGLPEQGGLRAAARGEVEAPELPGAGAGVNAHLGPNKGLPVKADGKPKPTGSEKSNHGPH